MLADGESLPIYSSPSGGVGAGSLGPRIMARLEDLVETALNGIPLRVNTRSVSLQTPATGPSSKSNSGDAGGDQQSNNTSTAACATPTNSLVALATADPSLPTEGWMAQIIVGAMEFRSPRMRPTKAMAIESAAVVAYRSLMEKLDRVHEIPPEFAGVDEVEDGEVEWQEEPSGSVSTMENNMSIVSSLFYNKKLPLTIAKSPAPSSSAAAAKGASSIEGGSTRPLSHKTPRQERTQLIKQHQHGNGGGSFANNNNNNYNNNSSKRFKHDHQNDSYKYYPPPPSNNRYGNNNTNNAMAGTRQSVPPPVQYTCNICNQKGHW